MITTIARTIAMPLAEDPVKRWVAYPQFHGPTRTLADMACHISVLSAGHHPHPPHIHSEEEILVVLDGAVEIELADSPAGDGSRRLRLEPGMLSYYPAPQHHTIHNAGPGPTTYLMLKWRAGLAQAGDPMPASVFHYDPAGASSTGSDGIRPIVQTLLFEQATHCLGKLHAHLTTLQPGAGYEAHVDAYDVAILLLAGQIETIGERVAPLGIVYYSAGEPHGMRNPGTVPAVYLVFEFHSPAAVAHLEAQRAEREAARAERQRRKHEKRQRKRGLRGLVRKVGKLFKRPKT